MITKNTPSVDFEEVPHNRHARLEILIHNNAFVLITAATGERIWYDPIDEIFYREYTCNGPSSWASGKLP